ncbi:hypothetical protein LSH36_168g03024 [Paralvinella palmiformis]|uniref:SET domain-containing protein n=1 Tax=Paralvinella palmiformis TaxID=53620 RepID=A0AAD9N7Q2_9ANNE|nr:hypothetical protein LSH36_168g03024 [Paralvinella palmiformis]
MDKRLVGSRITVWVKKRRRTDDAIPSLSPVTDIPIVNHGYHINSLPPKISPQKVAGISMFKPLSDKAKLKLAKLSPGLECLDAVPGTKKHHIEGASGADVHRLNDQFQGLPPYKFHNTPNGITYPVTPPHTPEHGVSPADAVRAESEENREIQGSDHRSDFIPVCFCKLPSAVVSNTLPGHKTSLYCQALDSVNGKIVGCCSKVTNGQMVRPAHKIPFMVLCESHRERLKMHQCCPGCGQFCTEGKFLQCKSEVTKKGLVILHHFHAQCRTYKANKYFCPHCAHESDQYEVTLKYAGSRASWATVDVLSPSEKRLRYDGSKSARMGVLSPMGLNQEVDGSSGIEITVPHTSKTISSKKFPLGPTRSELENAMSVLDSDRAKKLRQGSKNLYKASKTGDVEKVIVMLADGADPNLRYEDDHNQSPLHAAAGMGHHLITHLLLQAGASPHVLDNSLSTPIILAAEKANMQILQILVKSGGLVDARRADGMTSLHLAAQSGKVDAVRFLLETEKISVNVKDDGGWTPLIWAAEHSHLDVVHYLHIAARQDHYECVVLFLARGADSEARNNDNEAPIGFSIIRIQIGYTPILALDISYGRDSTPMPVVNMVDDENYPTDFLYVVDCVETTPMNVNRLITSLADGKLVKDFNYSDPPLIFECNKACRCWSSCQNRVVQLGITCRLQVFRTNGRGWGARTMLDIPQGTFVCEYIGELISDAEADSREDDSYLFDLDNKDTDTYCIDARHYGNISRFINHLFDYGEKFWIIKWKQFTCTCGSVKCRYSKDTIHKTLEDYNRRQGDDERVVEQP